MSNKPTILILHSELTAYALNNFKYLCEKANVHLVYNANNTEYNFSFNFPSNLRTYLKETLTFYELIKLTNDIKPNLVLISGWFDKDYIKLCKSIYQKTKIVLTMDTPWRGSLRQYLNIFRFKIYFKKYFHYIFVFGKPQKLYAIRLGFKESDILLGLYPADIDLFNNYYHSTKYEKAINFPHKFLYVGRYNKIKGVDKLWKAFIEFQHEYPNDWELICCGSGPLEKFKINHPKIHHKGFIQPNNFKEIISETGVFVLPSIYEAWGVVVQEFAAAGFPLLLSNVAGSVSEYLEEGKNGFLFEAGNIDSLKNAMKKITENDDKELLKMSEYSHYLAQKYTPEQWVNKILEIVNK